MVTHTKGYLLVYVIPVGTHCVCPFHFILMVFSGHTQCIPTGKFVNFSKQKTACKRSVFQNFLQVALLALTIGRTKKPANFNTNLNFFQYFDCYFLGISITAKLGKKVQLLTFQYLKAKRSSGNVQPLKHKFYLTHTHSLIVPVTNLSAHATFECCKPKISLRFSRSGNFAGALGFADIA